MGRPDYTDDDLRHAIRVSHSWRGVLRALGLNPTSASAARQVKRRAEQINALAAHFTGQRRWTEDQLRAAIAARSTWLDVANDLGLVPGGGASTSLKAHALRLGLDVRHLSADRPKPATSLGLPEANRAHLRDAGTFYAAAWLSLRGARVSWPLEPARYDLIADFRSVLSRIQVKTVSTSGPGALAMVSNSRRRGRAVYGPDEIDQFFVIDGDLSAYLIPYEIVAGYTQLTLGRYINFKIIDRGDLLSEVSSPAP